MAGKRESAADPDGPSGPPDDDSGALALAWFEFQLTLTAQACLGLLRDGDLVEIICEWEEDYIEIRGGSDAELVSVKHLEPSIGRWTLATIIDSGGIRHLFDRWKKSGGSATCRLRTNGGLNTGAKSAAALKRAATTAQGLEEMAVELANRIEEANVDDAREFIRRLTIEDELPKREDLLPKLLSDVIPPMCESLGWPPHEVSERFDAVLSVVRAAASSDMRSAARAITIDGPDSLTAEARARASKTIDRKRLAQALLRTRATHSTRMSVKLERGGLGPTDVERCKRLRADWLRFEHRWNPEMPGSSVLDDVRRRVQDIAFVAETTSRSASPYAAEMRDRFLSTLDSDPVFAGDERLPHELVLGAAYDETDRCRIWWSDRFDLPNRSGTT